MEWPIGMRVKDAHVQGGRNGVMGAFEPTSMALALAWETFETNTFGVMAFMQAVSRSLARAARASSST